MSDTNTAATPAPAVATDQVTAPVEGAPVAPATAEPAPADRLAKAAERLARDRQAVDADRKAIAAEKAAVESERAKVAQLQQLIAKAEEDPLAILDALGPDAGARLLARLAQQQALDEDPSVAEVRKLRAEIDAKEAAAKAERERQEQAQIDAKIESFMQGLRAHGEGNADKYELCALTEQHGLAQPFDLAFQVIEQHYAQTKQATGKGVVLSYDEALGAVESYLVEKYGTLFGASKKLKPAPIVETSEASKKPEANGARNVTLSSTSSMDGPVIVSNAPPAGKEARRAKLAQAIDRLS